MKTAREIGLPLLLILIVLMIAASPAVLLAATGVLPADNTPIGLAQEASWTTILAFYLPRLLDWLKFQPWFKAMQPDTARLNRIVAIIVAVVSALGVHWSFNSSTNGWEFLIGGPGTFGGFVGHALYQFAVMQFFY
jgi:hypothetical protein